MISLYINDKKNTKDHLIVP